MYAKYLLWCQESTKKLVPTELWAVCRANCGLFVEAAEIGLRLLSLVRWAFTAFCAQPLLEIEVGEVGFT